jgi:hypothetical protein
VCDGSTPGSRIRGAAGASGERVRGKGGSARFSPRVVARLGVFRQQIADGYWFHRMTGRVRPRRRVGRIARSHRSTARPTSGRRTLSIDRGCAVGHCVCYPGKSWRLSTSPRRSCEQTEYCAVQGRPFKSDRACRHIGGLESIGCIQGSMRPALSPSWLLLVTCHSSYEPLGSICFRTGGYCQ